VLEVLWITIVDLLALLSNSERYINKICTYHSVPMMDVKRSGSALITPANETRKHDTIWNHRTLSGPSFLWPHLCYFPHFLLCYSPTGSLGCSSYLVASVLPEGLCTRCSQSLELPDLFKIYSSMIFTSPFLTTCLEKCASEGNWI
jgi:hypothetical protein